MHVVHNDVMRTVREFGDFYADAIALLGEDSHHEMINHFAHYPCEGAIIQGTGGFRKGRWARANKGKSGGVRIIYFYDGQDLLSLLLIYAKGRQDTLSATQKKQLKEIAKSFTS